MMHDTSLAPSALPHPQQQQQQQQLNKSIAVSSPTNKNNIKRARRPSESHRQDVAVQPSPPGPVQNVVVGTAPTKQRSVILPSCNAPTSTLLSESIRKNASIASPPSYRKKKHYGRASSFSSRTLSTPAFASTFSTHFDTTKQTKQQQQQQQESADQHKQLQQSTSSLKSLDSLQVNLSSQAKKLEESIQSLASSKVVGESTTHQYDLTWLFPIEEKTPSNHPVVVPPIQTYGHGPVLAEHVQGTSSPTNTTEQHTLQTGYAPQHPLHHMMCLSPPLFETSYHSKDSSLSCLPSSPPVTPTANMSKKNIHHQDIDLPALLDDFHTLRLSSFPDGVEPFARELAASMKNGPKKQQQQQQHQQPQRSILTKNTKKTKAKEGNEGEHNPLPTMTLAGKPSNVSSWPKVPTTVETKVMVGSGKSKKPTDQVPLLDESEVTLSSDSQANDSKRQSTSTTKSSILSCYGPTPKTSVLSALTAVPNNMSTANVHWAKFASNVKERPLKDQMQALSPRERNCVALLRQHWDADHQPMPAHMYLLFARFCQFDLRKGRRHLANFDERYLTLTAARLESQLLTQTLFPIPGLKSIHGHDMFYMRPALFYPNSMKTQAVIDNLAYVMLTMIADKEEAATKGIGFLANMNEWTMENFSVDYCRQFMKMLQGGVPARVCLFLIVNPPSWFGRVWRIMKPMLHPNFRRKVKTIPEMMLPQFLERGYQTHLPNDMNPGTANTDLLVRDYVAYRKHAEEKKSKPTDL